jgi:hypothetical protein
MRTELQSLSYWLSTRVITYHNIKSSKYYNIQAAAKKKSFSLKMKSKIAEFLSFPFIIQFKI